MGRQQGKNISQEEHTFAKVRKGWHDDFFKVPNSIYDAPITGYAKSVYIYLCRRADTDHKSYPGYSKIAEDIGFSRRTVIRAMAELVESGLVVKTFRGRKENGEYWQNEYIVNHPDDVVFLSSDSKALLPPLGSSASQALGSASQALGSASQALGSASQAQEGKHTKENTLTIPTTNNNSPGPGAGQKPPGFDGGQALTDDVDDVGLGKFLEQNNVKASKTVIAKWLKMADSNTVRQAVQEAIKRPEVRNVVGYVTSILQNGYTPPTPANPPANKKEAPKEVAASGAFAFRNPNPKWESYYKLMEQSERRGGIFEIPAGEMEK